MKHNEKSSLPVSVKNRNDCADYDYISKLSPSELLWLKGFHQEWANDNFKHTYGIKHGARKRCDDANNARERCLYNYKKTRGQLILTSHPDVVLDKAIKNPWLQEEATVTLLDRLLSLK